MSDGHGLEYLKGKFAPYVGGQMRATNIDGLWIQGEISDIIVTDDLIRVKFAWLADDKRTKSIDEARWVKRECLDFVMRLDIYDLYEYSDVWHTIHAKHEPSQEDVIFFVPENRNLLYLDPARVEGLEGTLERK